MVGMIFAAGLGTRLKPLTDTMPKALVPLGGKPLIQWQVEKLRDAGITHIVVNVHHFADQIIDAIKAHNSWGCDIRISDERDQLLDTGGGLRKAYLDGLFAGYEEEPVLACNVDILSTIDLQALTTNPRVLSRKTSTLVVSARNTQRYLCFDEQDRLCGWTNIATGEIKGQDGRHLAFSGMQVLTPDVLRRLNEMPEEKFSLIPFYLHIMQQVPLQAYVPSDYKMMDVGKIEQIAEAEQFAATLCTKI